MKMRDRNDRGHQHQDRRSAMSPSQPCEPFAFRVLRGGGQAALPLQLSPILLAEVGVLGRLHQHRLRLGDILVRDQIVDRQVIVEPGSSAWPPRRAGCSGPACRVFKSSMADMLVFVVQAQIGVGAGRDGTLDRVEGILTFLRADNLQEVEGVVAVLRRPWADRRSRTSTMEDARRCPAPAPS